LREDGQFLSKALFIFLIVSVAITFVFILDDAYAAMECNQSRDSYYEMILDCNDTVDVRKSTMDYMYSDINRFSTSFEGAKVYNIRTEGSQTFATIEIPLPYVSDLKSDVKFSKSSNYLMEFLSGKLAGSKLFISLSVIDGYDGTKDGGSSVNFYFQIKDIPCYAWGFKCGSASNFEYALDRGLYLMEPLAKETQLKLDKEQSNQKSEEPTPKSTPTNNQKTPKSTETETKQTELRGPPRIDSDLDGIEDSVDGCIFDKETYNGYLDSDGCPDELPQLRQKTTIIDFDNDGIPDDVDMCRTQAEVYNGYIDWDGCPDTATGQIQVSLDNDNDGVLNHLDQCPTMRENYNGFKDEDGCPDAILDMTRQKTIILPDWLKNNAKWWSVSSIDDKDFVEGIKYMIKEDMIQIPITSPDYKSSFSIGKIPSWVKTNAGWWADDVISDDEFVRNIQYLIDKGIIELF